MDVDTGRDTATSQPEGAESVLAGVRRLTLLADGAANSEVIFRALAAELLAVPGAEEVHIHHVAGDGGEEELAGTLVDQAAAALALVRARAEAGTDPVAGCMNHRAMRRRLDEEIVRAARTGSPLSCLLIDLDDFKLVNDHHGHQAGDAVLREVAHALVGEFRAFDRVARYGGGEVG